MRVSQFLLTMVALAYAVIPPIVDFNTTHALHADWPGHARFHMVWLVVANSALGLFAIYQIWRRPSSGGLVTGGVISAIVLGAFFVSAATMSLYDGTLSDTNGVAPGPAGIDANLFLFSILFLINAIGLVGAFRGSGTLRLSNAP